MVLILATDDKVETFQQALAIGGQSAKTPRDLSDFALKRLVIIKGSALVGKTLDSAQIRQELKGLVVGLERGSVRSTNPVPGTELQIDDTLWVLGDA